MGDINRIFIFLILIGLIFSLYKYQDIILENFDSLQQSFSPQSVTPQQNINKPLSLPSIETPKQKITADNISQISLSTMSNGKLFDSMSNSENISDFLDNNSYDTNKQQTYGSLFED
jgi:hypothetical protein